MVDHVLMILNVYRTIRKIQNIDNFRMKIYSKIHFMVGGFVTHVMLNLNLNMI